MPASVKMMGGMFLHVVSYKLTDVSEALSAPVMRTMIMESVNTYETGQFLRDYTTHHQRRQSSSALGFSE
jgi:hypothetical protein